MFILPKVIDRSITIPIKIPMERDLCKMAEQKGRSSPALMKTSESKLNVEQPVTKNKVFSRKEEATTRW